mgnify:CR=1 FL=1
MISPLTMLYNIFLLPSFILLFFINPIKNIQKEYVTVYINSTKYSMEVANTLYKKALGLMYRGSSSTGGMVFNYKKATNPSYYNKNVRFPLRIYFIDDTYMVKASYVMQKNSFKTVSSNSKINYVVEVPLNQDLSGDPGEKVEIKIEDL